MKKKSVKLVVDEPCHEDWNAMTPQENGRYCGVCSKVVVDFTAMSDREVLSLLDTMKKGDTCGQFTESQLGRSLFYPVPETNSLNLKAVVLGASLTSLLSLESCKPEKHIVGALGIKESYTSNTESRVEQPVYLKSVENGMIISGKVVSEKDKAMEGVFVSVSLGYDSVLTETYSDEFGNFSVEIQAKEFPVDISFHKKGYYGRYEQISSKEKGALSTIQMNHRPLLHRNRVIRGKVGRF